MEPTKFAESNALLAIQDDDIGHAREILDGMLPGELRKLGSAARRLEDEAFEAIARQGGNP